MKTCCGSPAYAAPELVNGQEDLGAEAIDNLLIYTVGGLAGFYLTLFMLYYGFGKHVVKPLKRCAPQQP